ncbi:chondroitin sulfate proteoglycan 5 isoform X2 [Xenopus tropicalis]|uniref:Chondroitin sulfate proteoglycan 5 isoform X2 n=1 Tax=Xenopus tropicalis TaxID=8364 RepID=A0A8J1JP55_XENTR|nr:chondroitin sulfate proteoglycan 5 isoform X2 [Xenopus tropicalis]
MDSRLRCWSLAALLCPLLLLLRAEPQTGTGTENLGPEADNSYSQPAAGISEGVVAGVKAVERELKSGGEDFVGGRSPWSPTTAGKSQENLSTEAEGFAGRATGSPVATTDSPYTPHPSGPATGNNKSSTCADCRGEDIDRKPPVRSLLAQSNGEEEEEPVTGMVWPFSREALDLEIRKRLLKSGIVSATESQEDAGSGDRGQGQQGAYESPPGKDWDLGEFLDKTTASPSQATVTPSKGLVNPTAKAISPDSAEIDHLLQVSRETVLQSPSSSDTDPHGQGGQRPEKAPELVPEGATNPLAAQGAQGGTDVAMVTDKTESPVGPSVAPVGQDKASEAPPDHAVDDLINFDYYDLFNIDGHGGLGRFPGSSVPGGDSTKKKHDKKVPWPMPELYDDFTPFDESDFYPTTSFYADGDDDGGIEDDDDDDDIEDTDDIDDDDTGARDVANVPKAATLTPKVQTAMVDEKPTGRQHNPHQTFILYGGDGHPKFHPDSSKDLSQAGMNDSGGTGGECRNGYVRRNNSCRSLCDIYPTYCYNGGQCYIVENTGAFCRCNTQDYIWHKGIRCESIVTDFQVMCVAVGTAALVVLLLFMMTVFFAKKLYLLKTENYKLRKRKYRTPSELHNDNFSLSTIAEGSHPNVRKLCDTPSNLSPHARALAYYDNVICQEDPNAPQKVQDLPKACLKDEEPFNIQNSLSPKHDSGKGDPDIADVNCVLNNLT